MTADTVGAQMRAEAEQRVKTWAKLDRTPGSFHRCESGGFLVEVGEAFPIWRQDMGAVRSLLIERDLSAAELPAS